MLGGVGSSGGGDGGGVGVGDLKRSVSSTGSGDGLSLKASCSWLEKFDFLLSFLPLGLSGDLGSFYGIKNKVHFDQNPVILSITLLFLVFVEGKKGIQQPCKIERLQKQTNKKKQKTKYNILCAMKNI